ncbi:MAG: CNNM domain-containing protein [Pseudomonadota bacterium]
MFLLFFYLFIALFVSFLCSILEAVFLSTQPSYINSLDKNTSHRKILLALKQDTDSAISAILTLNTIAHTMGAAGVGAEAVRIFGVQWQSLIAIILTLLILYFSEIIPKTIGATYWRELSRPSSHIIAFLIKILKPLIWISRQITKGIHRHGKQELSRKEISAMIEIGEKSGSLEEKESRLMENLLDLKQVRVRDILTPRGVVFSLNAEDSIKSSMAQSDIFIYSRIPVYEQRNDNIIGMVFSRTILKSNALQDAEENSISSVTRPVYRVSEKLPVFFLLDLFIERKEHLFIVNDSYEQYMGIVTLEDALETLLGVEIVDEADKVADMQQLAREKARHWKENIYKLNRLKR